MLVRSRKRCTQSARVPFQPRGEICRVSVGSGATDKDLLAVCESHVFQHDEPALPLLLTQQKKTANLRERPLPASRWESLWTLPALLEIVTLGIGKD